MGIPKRYLGHILFFKLVTKSYNREQEMWGEAMFQCLRLELLLREIKTIDKDR